ncbi:isocitrate/isopropylmalate dehydrogenase family protein [Pseudoalteromonas sp. SCSIO 43210]
MHPNQKTIAVIPGDGIGKEVTAQSLKIIQFFNANSQYQVDVQQFNWDADFYLEHGYMLKPNDIESLQQNYDAILFGAIGDPRIPDMQHGRELLLALRQELDLYVNYRPIRTTGLDCTPLKAKRAGGIDIAIFRENTQGLYCQIGGSVQSGLETEAAIDTAYYSKDKVLKFINAAFAWADANKRAHVDLVDKANAITNVGKLWRDIFKAVARRYPHITTNYHYVDAYCQQMVMKPNSIDVVVTSNLFGDILGDLAASLVGGLGITESGNINPESKIGLFEPVHGSAPDIYGQGIANPIASFSSLALLYDHLGFKEISTVLTKAISHYLCYDEFVKTPDLGGSAKTTQVTQDVINLCQQLINK